MRHTGTPVRYLAPLGHTLMVSVVLLAMMVAAGTYAPASIQRGGHPRHPRPAADLMPEMRDAVALVEATPGTKAKRANISRNARGTYEAFTLEVPIDGDENNVREVIFIEDRRRGKIYEVRGYDFPRPFTDFAWRGNDTLIFDQWMQPHYAVHYEIDVRRGKLVAATSFWEPGFEP